MRYVLAQHRTSLGEGSMPDFGRFGRSVLDASTPAIVALAIVALQAVAAGATEPKDGGSVVMATRAQVQGFDVLTIRVANRETTMAGALIFSSYFTLNEKGESVPDLATAL